MKGRQLIPVIIIISALVIITALIYFLASPNTPDDSGNIILKTDQAGKSQETGANISGSSNSNIETSNVDLRLAATTSQEFGSSTIYIKAPNGTIDAIVATSSQDQEKGLGRRISMPPTQGMIFVFATEGSYGFWMKDMHFPLDMVWIDQNQMVVGVTAAISPSTYPNIILPPSPILYVLELNSGYANRFGITSGTKLEF